jgi:hypothetical protein
MPPLPAPVTNNAVVLIPTRDSYEVITALGLGSGKTWRDTLSAAWRWTPGSARWIRLPDVPGPGGRLAAAAVAVGGHAYVFGGYTVAEDGSEASAPDVLRLEPDGRWSAVATMPVPVDDAVALPWQDRYVYLVSGWHDLGNVNLVQLYDARTNRWSQATPWPGEPVFGHAGGIAGDVMVVCDGVRLAVSPRRFETVRQCFAGEPEAGDPRRISWSAMPHHGGPALYRAAAVGSAGMEMIVFAGGTDVPYNFDGIGYDSRPATPSPRIFGWRVGEGRWEELGRTPRPTMDHRGLLETPDGFFVIGGLDPERRVLSRVTRVPVTTGLRE